MYNNDYVSFNGQYALNEQLDYDAKEFLADVAVDFVGDNLHVPPNASYTYGTDQYNSMPGNYDPYYDNLNETPIFKLNKYDREIGKRFKLPGNPKFTNPGSVYQYQSYNQNPQKNKPDQFTYRGKINKNNNEYDRRNYAAAQETTSYKFPKFDYTKGATYPYGMYGQGYRSINSAFADRVMSSNEFDPSQNMKNRPIYDFEGHQINRHYPKSMIDDDYEHVKKTSTSMLTGVPNLLSQTPYEKMVDQNKKYHFSNNGTIKDKNKNKNNNINMEDNLPRKSNIHFKTNVTKLIGKDSGKINYNKVDKYLHDNEVSEIEMTNWEKKHFEDSADMDEYDGDATYNEYAYTSDNDNMNFDFGDNKVDYIDDGTSDDYTQYNSTKNMSKFMEVSSTNGKQKLRNYKREKNNLFNPVDEAEGFSGIKNNATNGFGKPSKSKYKLDVPAYQNIINYPDNLRLINDMKEKLEKLSFKISDIGPMLKKEHDGFHQNIKNIYIKIRDFVNGINDNDKISETELPILNSAIESLNDVVTTVKTEVNASKILFNNVIDKLKNTSLAKSVALINESVVSLTELSKETTKTMWMLRILLFIIILAIIIGAVKYLLFNDKKEPTGKGESVNPAWLHTNE